MRLKLWRKAISAAALVVVGGLVSSFVTRHTIATRAQELVKEVLVIRPNESVAWLSRGEVQEAPLDPELVRLGPHTGLLGRACVRRSQWRPVPPRSPDRPAANHFGYIHTRILAPFVVVVDFDGQSWHQGAAHDSGFVVHGRAVYFAIFGAAVPGGVWHTGYHWDGAYH